MASRNCQRLASLRGHRRYNAISALRSLFRFAKRRGLIFADPTRHLGGGRQVERVVLPMGNQEVHAIQQATASPAQRLVMALTAVHAARPKAVRELTLDDVDLPNRRITIPGLSATSPTRSCWPGWNTGVPPGPTPPTGIC